MSFNSPIEIKPEFLGITAVNSFAAYNSSPRMVMFFNHFSQRPSLLTPEKKIVKSGIEYELSKYINDIRTEEDCVVRAVIPRYFNSNFSLISSVIIIVEYEKEINGVNKIVFDYIEAPYYKTQHSVFGYTLQATELLENIHINQEIPKDSVLSTTASNMDDGSYGYGVNANVAFMSIPEVSEDGFVVSRSFLDKIKMKVIETRTIYINKDTIPLNLYGDLTNFKFLPNIGENVRADGLLCAVRKRNEGFSVADLNDKSLLDYDPLFDHLTYVKTNSKVIDIKVVKANYKKNEFPNKVTEQLDTYANLLNTFYRTLSDQVNKLIETKRVIFNSLDYVELSPKLHRLMTDIALHLDATAANSKVKLVYRKLPICQYKIDIVTETTLVPNMGFKLTCTHA